MLGAEMEVRVEEGGEGVLSISVLLGRKSSDVSLCGSPSAFFTLKIRKA
ncbi:hypothetical protein T05_16515 [Trichinella murrelli]|uniref:Uncharacterized protein n=1 Tax=Trichinella murrelli TaxID=144512 RepID=A0A0V0U9L2_9BILA|nr:hypothetical protein T05_16515 [Trichinella murrelli]